MSLTNSDVQKRFGDGRIGSNGRDTLRAVRGRGPTDGATVLMSYNQPIAIRRDADGAVFADGHSYSSTTSQHQLGTGRAFSFDCVAELIGGEWWRAATVQDSGPHVCENTQCRAERERREGQWRATFRYGPVWPERVEPGDAGRYADPRHDQFYDPGYPEWDMCLEPNGADEHGAHAVTIPDYDGWHATGAVLLSFADGRQVLTGHEPGKRERYGGRTDQLWAAILPRHARDIRAAFGSLRPQSLQTSRYGDDETPAHVRQGDLYFRPYEAICSCRCHDPEFPFAESDRYAGPLADAVAPDGRPFLAKTGVMRKRHGCDPCGYSTVGPGRRAAAWACRNANNPLTHGARDVGRISLPLLGRTRGNHTPRQTAIHTTGHPVLVRGRIEHPEHPSIMLHEWHIAERGMAVRAVSAPLSSPHGTGRGAYAD